MNGETPDTPAHPVVLHIDDDPLLRSALGSVLEGANYTVLSAGGGREGIDTALAHHPKVIVTDYQMPDIDGMTVIKEIRSQGGDWGLHVPIIFATNTYDLAAMNELMRYNVTDYIIKSDIDPDGIVRVVAKYA